jgi:hypothetical protein
MTGSRTSSPDRPAARKPPPPPAPLIHDAPREHALAPPRDRADCRYRPIYQINEQCIDLLVEAARRETHPAPGLVVVLRTLLLRMTPQMRTQAAQRALLLVDMGFRDVGWWKDARREPRRGSRTPIGPDPLPTRAALNLARSSLVLAWHSIQANPMAAGLMLGISRPVASVISSLSLTDLEHIAEKRFRRLRPRWEDRPGLWRQLLLSVEATDFRKEREFNLRALQLAAGELFVAPPDE